MKRWMLACRSLSRRPAFTLTVVGLLCLGIGSATALFAVVDTVLLEPLPFPASSRLVTVFEASVAKGNTGLVAPARLSDWNRLARAFAGIAGSYSENVTDTGGSEPQRLAGVRVSPGYFNVFGMAPAVGRTFSDDEERPGGRTAAVISHELWIRQYGGRRDLERCRLVIAGEPHAIVGVMPSSFANPKIDIWLPAKTPPFLMQLRDARFFSGVGRMRAGVTIAQARADLASVQRALGETFPATDKGWTVALTDLKEARTGSSSASLWLLFGSVMLLMAIALANIAGLVLAQLGERQRELAIRASLGATRAQVVATVVRELALLAGGGVLGGCAVALASARLLVRIFGDVPRVATELHVPWLAFLVAAGAGLLAIVVCGVLPALRATGARSFAAVGGGSRAVIGQRRGLQRALVLSQIAVTMTLLVTAAALVRTWSALGHADLGLDASGVMAFHVGAAWNEDRVRVGRLQVQLLDEIGRVPGVRSVGFTNFLPAGGATLRYAAALDGATNTDNASALPVGTRLVTPGYLRALRVPLLAGSWCPDFGPPVVDQAGRLLHAKAMVNRRFVEMYAGGANVLGRQIAWIGMPGEEPVEITGVIGDVKEDGPDAAPYPFVYSCAVAGAWPDPEYAIRTSGDPRVLFGEVARAVHRVDPARAVFGVQTLSEALDRALDSPRSNARMLSLFAGAAMVLAAVGLYGLLAQIVRARRQEIGVRMALGAGPAQILRAVLADAGRLAAGGMVVGTGLIVVAQSLLRSLVPGASRLDGVSLLACAGLITVVALTAAIVPARRAATVDPTEAIHAE